MKLKDARENYYFHSSKVSDISRQMALAALALVWFFHGTTNGLYTIPPQLKAPAYLAVGVLVADFLQYTCATICWGIFQRIKEKQLAALGNKDAEFSAPNKLNWLALLFFSAKLILVVITYWKLLSYLITSIRVPG